jgi:hypothetical protein
MLFLFCGNLMSAELGNGMRLPEDEIDGPAGLFLDRTEH